MLFSAPEDSINVDGKKNPDSVSRRFVRGVSWSAAGAVISQALMLLTFMMLARKIGKDEFGRFGIVQSTLVTFGMFLSFGVGATATRSIASDVHRNPARAARILGLSSVTAIVTGAFMTALVAIAAPLLAAGMSAEPGLAIHLRRGSLLLLCLVLSGSQAGILAGFESFSTIAVLNTLRGLTTLLLVTIGGKMWGIDGAIGGVTLATAVVWSLGEFAERRCRQKTGIRIDFRNCLQERAILWTFSLPAILANGLVGPANWVAMIILLRHTHGFGEIALLTAANHWRTALLFLPNVVSQVILPILSGLNGSRMEEQRRFILANLALVVGVTTFGATAVGVASKTILQGYGAKFQDGRTALLVLAASTIFASACAVCGQVLASRNRMWQAAGGNALWACTLLLLCVPLAPHGAAGIATANLIAYGIAAIAMLICIHIDCPLISHRSWAGVASRLESTLEVI